MITDESIKVLHVVGQMNRGGTEALLMSLLRITDRERFQYDFVEQTQNSCDYDEEIKALGSTIYRCPTISPTSLSSYRGWWRTFLQQHPEYRIIHGHSRGSGPIYLKEANKAGRITIAHCHSNSFGFGMKGLVRRIWQTPLKNIADYNFACSYESGISQYGKRGKFQVLRNGIMTSSYIWNPTIRQKVRQDFSLGESLVVGNVARFEEPKNHRFLIEIFYEIQKLCPDARLLLVGGGTLEDEIHKQADALKISEKVIFAGVRSDVNELLQAMDVFVLPSHFEGLGIVNIEAQAAGLPCFVSAKVVPPEARVTDLLQYIPLDAGSEVWARRIIAGVIRTEDRRDTSEEIRKAGFDIHTTARELEDFYIKIMGNHHAG